MPFCLPTSTVVLCLQPPNLCSVPVFSTRGGLSTCCLHAYSLASAAHGVCLCWVLGVRFFERDTAHTSVEASLLWNTLWGGGQSPVAPWGPREPLGIGEPDTGAEGWFVWILRKGLAGRTSRVVGVV